MRDTFCLHIHGLTEAGVGGIYHVADRPHPTSSAGTRRVRAAKNRTRRTARRRSNRDALRDID